MVPRLARQPMPFALLFAAASMLLGSAVRAEPAETAQAVAFIETGSVEPAAGAGTLRTRFIIGLGKKGTFEVQTLTNPNRVIVDLDQTNIHLPDVPKDAPMGLVSSFQAGVGGPGRTRVVIHVTGPVVVASQTLEKSPDGKGHRLAIEIAPVAQTDKTARKAFAPPHFALGAAGLQPPSPREAVRPDVMAAKSYKPVIVIDPGHGGHDSGAMKNGTVEKDVVLAFSKALKKKLEDSGRYRVLMTRDKDVFVELDERRAFGERNKAALFIAVHADYAQTKARGATIFSLRDSVAKSLEGSAKREIAEHVLTGTEVETVKKAGGSSDVSAVKSILGDLARREVDTTKERTNLFSRAVIEYMGESTNMRDNPDQQAAFRVLKTAQFPSVLIELAYVTNKEDAAQLKSDAWRGKVADSIKSAVDTYFAQQVARLPM